MASSLAVEGVIEALRTHGDPRESWHWHEGETDYVALYELTAEHVPALVALASQWGVAIPEDERTEENVAVYGPVHAWRALGQLHAFEVVEPLLAMQDQLDAWHDDWYLEEFHDVFGLVGPPAIPALSAYLADESHGEFPRISAADGLGVTARRFPETREEIVSVLSQELTRHQAEAESLNGFLVSFLLDLKGVEAAETIERAFAANVVDPTVVGHWGKVRQLLGVPGLGIAPDKSPGWTTLGERVGFKNYYVIQERIARERKREQTVRRQAKAKRKQQKQSRKRNRK